VSSEFGAALFGATLHDMLADADVPGAARRWADGDRGDGLALWRRLAGLGVTALAVPEKRGGLGASPLDLVVACSELGHHAVPGPVAESVAAVPVLLGELGADRLAELAAGELIATLAVPPRVPFAADAEAAGLVLLASAEAGEVWLGRPGAGRRSVDPARSLADVQRGELLARDAGAAVARALEFGALACSAQLLGAGRALLEASVRHASVRAQFGRPVGAFQAVKHRLADVAIALEFARPLLDAAAEALAADGAGPTAPDGAGSAGAGTAARDVSAAKVACADAAYLAARAALQVHGAIGYTAEHDLSLWLAKVRALVPAWGTQAEHRARVVRELT
jgi:alkylation response protein AidB-like acyl-CoA dehydrogenase